MVNIDKIKKDLGELPWILIHRQGHDSILTTDEKFFKIAHHFLLNGMSTVSEVYELINSGEIDYLFPHKIKKHDNQRI